MKKAHLAQKLSKLEGFDEPKVSLEQYVTPPALAADLIYTAYMQGDIEGKTVLDLGAGPGILSIGAALLGANVIAVEKDGDVIEILERNAEKMGVELDVQHQDISEIDFDVDTAIMNPPFSVHSEEGEKFVRKAFSSADSVYLISNRSMRERIKDFAETSNHEIRAVEEFKISLPATYGFHTQENRETPVDLIITKRKY